MSFLLFENTCLFRPSVCNLSILVLLGDLILLTAPEAFPILWSCVRYFDVCGIVSMMLDPYLKVSFFLGDF